MSFIPFSSACLLLHICVIFLNLNIPHEINSISIRTCEYTSQSYIIAVIGNWVRLVDIIKKIKPSWITSAWCDWRVARERPTNLWQRWEGGEGWGRELRKGIVATSVSKQQSQLTIKSRLYRAALPQSHVLGARSSRSCAIYTSKGGCGSKTAAAVGVCMRIRIGITCIRCIRV